MVSSNFACNRIASEFVEPGANALLNVLNNFLILKLNLVQVGARALPQFALVPHVRKEFYFGARRTHRADHVKRKAPWIKVKHHVREYPEVIACHPLAMVA